MPMSIPYVLQRCSGDVIRRSYIRRLFDKAVNASEESALLDVVFTEWTRKIMHARVNDWFSARKDATLTAKGKHSRSGHILRDTLYALSKRSKKSKSTSASMCNLEGQEKRTIHRTHHFTADTLYI